MLTMPSGAAKNRKNDKLSDKDFNFIRSLVGQRTGIVLSDLKRDMVYGRLVRRLRQLGLSSFTDYCNVLKNGNEHELNQLTNAITTNLTSFFREPHHFEFLSDTLLPELIRHKRDRKLRIWSAGCSSGEEPYSIAMTIKEIVTDSHNWDIRILATDIDSNMIVTASSGIYSEDRINGIGQSRLKRWFYRGKGSNEGLVKASNELKELISFKQLNLIHEWPMKGPFDFIFCRNVVIYFSKETQKVLFNRFANLLDENAHLFIGHSESLYKVCDQFKLFGKTIYQKVFN